MAKDQEETDLPAWHSGALGPEEASALQALEGPQPHLIKNRILKIPVAQL